MHADEDARETARRLVQEALSDANGTLAPQPERTEAQRIAHRVVLDTLAAAVVGETAEQRSARRRGAGVLARPPVGSRPPERQVRAESAVGPEPVAPEAVPAPQVEVRATPEVGEEAAPEVEPAPQVVAEKEPVAEADVASLEGAAPEAAVDVAVGAQPLKVPARAAAPVAPAVSPASVEVARRIVAQTLDEHAARSSVVVPPEPTTDETARTVSTRPGTPDEADAGPSATEEPDIPPPAAGVNLLETGASPAPVGPMASEPAPMDAGSAGAPLITDGPRPAVDEPTRRIPPVTPPPVGDEPGPAALLLDSASVMVPMSEAQDEYERQVPEVRYLTPLDRWRARRHRKRLAAQWAPGSTPQPRRTWRWVLATLIVAIAIGVLFPLTVAAFRALVAL